MLQLEEGHLGHWEVNPCSDCSCGRLMRKFLEVTAIRLYSFLEVPEFLKRPHVFPDEDTRLSKRFFLDMFSAVILSALEALFFTCHLAFYIVAGVGALQALRLMVCCVMDISIEDRLLVVDICEMVLPSDTDCLSCKLLALDEVNLWCLNGRFPC